MRKRLTLVGGALWGVIILGGCTTAAIPPTYTQGELKAICERHNGWWHPNDLIDGYCEGFP
jgi:hypothetical protein